jgi:hypothetical protein
MCRSIKVLRRPQGRASEQEIEEAALQFVRKISGYRTPSKKNADAFETALHEVRESSARLLESLALNAPVSASPPKTEAGRGKQQNHRRDREVQGRRANRRSLSGSASI